uniref:C-type lectin domain-containing protein n=1 Tax=Rhabditophanes sp. KR3021 TaxID=114890 RepID=A0AC35TJ58_9BILA
MRSLWLLLVLLFLWIDFGRGQDDDLDKSCPQNWEPLYDEKGDFKECIIISHQPKSWRKAVIDCITLHKGQLITFKDERELNYVMHEFSKSYISYAKSHKKSVLKSRFWYGIGQICPNMDDTKKPTFKNLDGSIFDPIKAADVIHGVHVYKSGDKNDWKEGYCISYSLSEPDSDNAIKKIPHFVYEPCGNTYSYICKAPAKTLAKGTMDEQPDYSEDEMNFSEKYPCGNNLFWCPIKIGEKGYKCFGDIAARANWYDARNICKGTFHGNLASIHSKEESNFVTKLASLAVGELSHMNSTYWIGLNRNNQEKKFGWSDNTMLNFMESTAPFESVRLENEHSDGNCMAIKSYGKTENFGWHQLRCDERILGICERNGFNYKEKTITKSPKSTLVLTNTGCNETEKYYNGMCYQIYGLEGDNKLTFDDAKKACEDKNSILVSITNVYEQALVTSMLTSVDSDVWIGLEVVNGIMRWVDQEPIQYSKISPSSDITEDDNMKLLFNQHGYMALYRDSCVSVDAKTHIGYWNIIPRALSSQFDTESGWYSSLRKGKTQLCGNTKLPYMCQKHAEKVYSSKVQNEAYMASLSSSIPDSDVDFCYLKNNEKLKYKSKVRYDDAERTCFEITDLEEYESLDQDKKKLSGVAMPDNVYEWSNLIVNAEMHLYEEFWVGMKHEEESGFVRKDFKRINMGPWGPNEPNLNNGHCVFAKVEGTGVFWYMTDCDKKKETICKISMKPLTKKKENKLKCPDGKEKWILGKTKCYQAEMSADNFVTGMEAPHACYSKHRAKLASFPTKEDFEMFTNFHFTQDITNAKLFIGLVKTYDSTFSWIDNEPVIFLNWNRGEPHTNMFESSNRACTVVDLNIGHLWASESCYNRRGYICSVDAVDVNEIGNLPPQQDEAKDDSIPELPPAVENEEVEEDKKPLTKAIDFRSHDVQDKEDDDEDNFPALKALQSIVQSKAEGFDKNYNPYAAMAQEYNGPISQFIENNQFPAISPETFSKFLNFTTANLDGTHDDVNNNGTNIKISTTLPDSFILNLPETTTLNTLLNNTDQDFRVSTTTPTTTTVPTTSSTATTKLIESSTLPQMIVTELVTTTTTNTPEISSTAHIVFSTPNITVSTQNITVSTQNIIPSSTDVISSTPNITSTTTPDQTTKKSFVRMSKYVPKSNNHTSGSPAQIHVPSHRLLNDILVIPSTRRLYILLISSIHEMADRQGLRCGSVDVNAFLRLSSFLKALQDINNSNQMRNSALNIGAVIIDTCSSDLRTLADLYELLSGTNIQKADLIAIVKDDAAYLPNVDEFAQTLGIPILNTFFSHNTFPMTIGMLPSTLYAFDSIGDFLVHQESTCVSMISDQLHLETSQKLPIIFKNKNICIEESIRLDGPSTIPKQRSIIQQLLLTQARFIVVLYDERSLLDFLAAASMEMVLPGRFVLLGLQDSKWSTSKTFLDSWTQFDQLLISVESHNLISPTYIETLAKSFPNLPFPVNWLKQFWSAAFKCHIDTDHPSENKKHGAFSKSCDPNQKLIIPSIAPNVNFAPIALAVHSIASGLKNLVDEVCPGAFISVLTDCLNDPHTPLYNAIKKVSFKNPVINYTDTFSINQLTNAANSELTINKVITQGGQINYQPISTWSPDFGFVYTSLTNLSIEQRDGTFTKIVSVCPKSNCMQEVTLNTKSRGMPMLAITLNRKSVILFAFIAFTWAIICAFGLYHRLFGSLAMSPYRVCYATLFIGFAFTSIVSIFFIASPTDITCTIRKSCLAVGLTLIFASLLVKTVSSWRVNLMYAKRNSSEFYQACHPGSGLLISMVGIFVLLQVIIVVEWALFKNLSALEFGEFKNEYGWRCAPGLLFEDNLFKSLSLNGALILICLVISIFNARDDESRETILISFIGLVFGIGLYIALPLMTFELRDTVFACCLLTFSIIGPVTTYLNYCCPKSGTEQVFTTMDSRTKFFNCSTLKTGDYPIAKHLTKGYSNNYSLQYHNKSSYNPAISNLNATPYLQTTLRSNLQPSHLSQYNNHHTPTFSPFPTSLYATGNLAKKNVNTISRTNSYSTPIPANTGIMLNYMDKHADSTLQHNQTNKDYQNNQITAEDSVSSSVTPVHMEPDYEIDDKDSVDGNNFDKQSNVSI